MGVALVLDVLPTLVLVGVLGLMFAAAGSAGSAVAEIVEDAAGNPVVNALSMAFPGGVLINLGRWAGFITPESMGAAAGAVTTAGLSTTGGFALFSVSFFIFAAATVAAAIIAFSIFPLWFYFGYNYIMVSFLHYGKVAVNATSFLLVSILKLMPIINLFPIPLYTLTIWRHVQISRHEDKKKHEKLVGKLESLTRMRATAHARGDQARLRRIDRLERQYRDRHMYEMEVVGI